MDSITRFIEVDTAHRVPLHHSKCKNLHGHRYKFTAEITGDLYTEGSQTGMVLDYGFLKDLLMENIDKHIDHAIVISIQDASFFEMAMPDDEVKENIRKEVGTEGFWSGGTHFGKTYFIHDYPTAENLARHFFKVLTNKVSDMTHRQARLSAIIINETPNSSATYRPIW